MGPSRGDIRDAHVIRGSGRSPRRGHGNSIQYSWLENPMAREALWAMVYIVTKRWTQLKRHSFHAHMGK